MIKTLVEILYEILDKGWKKDTPIDFDRVDTIADAVQWAIRIHLEHNPFRANFQKIWHEALDSLPLEKQLRVIMHDKHEIESRILSQHPSSSWQKAFEQNIKYPTKLTLYGCCDNCKRAYPKILNYKYYRMNLDSTGFVVPLLDCDKCGGKRCLLVKADVPQVGDWIID